MPWRRPAGATAGDAQFGEAISGLDGFRALGITRDQAAQFLDACVLLPKLEIGEALLELGSGAFVTSGILVQYLVVVLDGSLEVAATIVNLAQIELRVAGQIVVAVYLQELSKLLRR